MSFKENLKEFLSNKDEIDLLRLNSTKGVLIFSIFLFFLNFFLLGANIKFEIFKYFLPFTYFFLLISMMHYFYFLIKIKVTKSKGFGGIIFFLLFVLFVLLFLPFIFDYGLSDLVNHIKLLFN